MNADVVGALAPFAFVAIVTLFGLRANARARARRRAFERAAAAKPMIATPTTPPIVPTTPTSPAPPTSSAPPTSPAPPTRRPAAAPPSANRARPSPVRATAPTAAHPRPVAGVFGAQGREVVAAFIAAEVLGPPVSQRPGGTLGPPGAL